MMHCTVVCLHCVHAVLLTEGSYVYAQAEAAAGLELPAQLGAVQTT